MLAPFIWMVSTSFKYNWDAISFPPRFLPTEFAGFTAYARVLSEIPFFSFLWNSLIVATTITLGTLFTSSLAGYIFGKFDFWGRNILFLGILATMMVPFEVILIPVYIIVRDLGMLNSLTALIIPRLVSAYGIFLMRQFMMGIPTALVDAARIDGCSEFGIYSRIVLPLSKPALSALGIFIFMFSWDDFLWPVLVIDDMAKRTLPLGLALFRQTFGTLDWNVIMAGTLLSILPVLIVFFAAQKNFIEGITLSGLKG
ncbi:MAG: carbohydrate ABC transporter permease [Firmicutes bacterium]|nr:carbohydrate ABC transporter permease [Bacillota bacterium]